MERAANWTKSDAVSYVQRKGHVFSPNFDTIFAQGFCNFIHFTFSFSHGIFVFTKQSCLMRKKNLLRYIVFWVLKRVPATCRNKSQASGVVRMLYVHYTYSVNKTGSRFCS